MIHGIAVMQHKRAPATTRGGEHCDSAASDSAFCTDATAGECSLQGRPWRLRRRRARRHSDSDASARTGTIPVHKRVVCYTASSGDEVQRHTTSHVTSLTIMMSRRYVRPYVNMQNVINMRAWSNLRLPPGRFHRPSASNQRHQTSYWHPPRCRTPHHRPGQQCLLRHRCWQRAPAAHDSGNDRNMRTRGGGGSHHRASGGRARHAGGVSWGRLCGPRTAVHAHRAVRIASGAPPQRTHAATSLTD